MPPTLFGWREEATGGLRGMTVCLVTGAALRQLVCTRALFLFGPGFGASRRLGGEDAVTFPRQRPGGKNLHMRFSVWPWWAGGCRLGEGGWGKRIFLGHTWGVLQERLGGTKCCTSRILLGPLRGVGHERLILASSVKNLSIVRPP